MSSDTIKLLEAALKLPVEARAALAGSLLDSLDNTIDADAEAAWEVEIARRLQELNSPQTRLILWNDARHRIAGF